MESNRSPGQDGSLSKIRNARERRRKILIFIRHEASRMEGDTIMNLNDTQRDQISRWVADGLKLSEIQNKAASELDLRLTYMEVRFLVDDLKLTLKDPEPPKPVLPPAPAPAPVPTSVPPVPDGSPALPAVSPSVGAVSVTMDQMAKPGTMVSGKVTFSDGQLADWYLDQNGRLGVVTQQAGYKPSENDVREFQLALEAEMQKMGF